LADNVTLPGTGTAIDTRDIGSGVERQRMDSFVSQVTVDLSITRPADTTAYAANDALANSTSAPTTGGFTFTSAGRISGGAGIILDAEVTSSKAASTLQGEVWLFDQAVTAINDNAAFSPSAANALFRVGVIPFSLNGETNFGRAEITGLGIGFTCVGSANLRALVKVTAAYTPASGEVLTVRLKIAQTT
jgi:hypothetical protein